jgi:hypothetical protein
MKSNELSHLLFCQKELKNFQSNERSFNIENINNPRQKKFFLHKYVKKHSLIISKLKNFPFLIENVVYKNKNLKRSNLLKRLEKSKNQLNFTLNLNQKFINNDFKVISKIIKTTKTDNKIKFLSKKSKIILNYCRNEKAAVKYKLDYKGMTGFTFEVQNLNQLYNYCKKNEYTMTKLINIKIINKLKIFFVRLKSGLIIEILQKL